jgi:aryl-alcohol dehydrogenase-like predicted oxidoreductase
MKYRMIGTDPKTRRQVSVLSLGAMRFGTATDEATSFAILDRYAEAGGTFIDTADNYAFWVNSTPSVAQLDESLAAVDLELTAEQRARLDAAR